MSSTACRSCAFKLSGCVGKQSVRTLAAIEDGVWISDIASKYQYRHYLQERQRRTYAGEIEEADDWLLHAPLVPGARTGTGLWKVAETGE